MPIPLSVSWVLVYSGFTFLLVYYLRVSIPRMLLGLSPGPVRAAMWLGTGGGAYLQWLSCIVGSLIVVHLWLCWRAARRPWTASLPYLVAGLIVLLIHWSLAQTLDQVPVYFLRIP